MTLIPGTNVAAPIVPGDTNDVFPTHDAQYGRGGYRAVASNVERDAIPVERRSAGMIVRTLSTGINWVLGADLVTWSGENSTTLENLRDVTITSKSDADIIAYNAATGSWVNKPQEQLVDGGNW